MKINEYRHKFYDKKGYPIYEGDVLKVYHFQAALRRQHFYMYKIVFNHDGYLMAAHAHKIYEKGLTLENSYGLRYGAVNKGDYWLCKSTEIIEGYHGGVSFDKREIIKL